MEKICDSYSTGALYDFVSRSENLEEYRNILESLADQKQNWTYIINDIMKERGLSASKMAELCGVSRQSVQKWLKGSVPKSRETYIKIGFAAHYNLKQMNYFLQRYGCVNKLYPKSIIETLAQNEGAGNITAMGAGLGMAMGVGSTIGNMANQVFQNAPEMQNMQSYEDPIVVLEKLKKLLAAGLITEEDYDTKKKEVLSRM